MADKKIVEGRIRLNNVRLSFPQLFRPQSFQNADGRETEPRRKANFLFPKDVEGQKQDEVSATYKGQTGPILALLKKAKRDAIVVKLGADKADAMMGKIKADKYAVRDGDMETWDGYEGQFYCSASNTRKVKCVGRHNKQELTEEDGILYAGCYVNAIVTLWFQPAGKKGDNVVPNAVWATLNAVQFVEDGEAFGAPEVDTESEFDNLIDETDQVSTEDDFSGDDDSPL